MNKKTVVAGVLQDIHVLGMLLIKGALEQAGYNVVYVGEKASQDDFINAAVETNAGAILISSSSGQSWLDCASMREKCIEAGIGNILMYLGGALVIDPTQEQKWENIEKSYKEMGYDRVYPATTSIDNMLADLKSDLAKIN